MKIIKRLFFKFMLLASTHCTVGVGVDAHFTIAPSLNPIHTDIESGREIERFATGGDSFTEVMAVESEYNLYGERTRVRSSLGADTEPSSRSGIKDNRR